MDKPNINASNLMNTTWLTLSKERRIEILNQATEITGLPAIAIEKDWWVSLCLQAAFSLPYSEHIVFKGGTSLSKGWDLIERFSEDIDLAIDRKFFGFHGDISRTQIRKQSCEFISTEFLKDLTKTLTDWGAIADCKLFAQPLTDSDKDPQIIEIHYNSVVDTSEYLPKRVLIEVSSRSLMEPTEKRKINSILSMHFPKMGFASDVFASPTVLPKRTFLEKIFLLHEEFAQEFEKIRVNRLSRHLYDLERLMDTSHGLAALQDQELYFNIVAHREKFNSLRGLDYTNHMPDRIKIIPPDKVIKEYQSDYAEMTKYMIYGNTLPFAQLLNRITELQKRINSLK
ncbi:nucleotidyl transferase AbiEii/AbiGii toxin family protein [Cytophagales bacterium LB-30]|uniref:Nucleotidyl transferase AbiEii/AbiGii toxin family protein n=1 Tax=Shiella aurantiaca TaxID=3058365 RepID=A0ABT8F7H6_9BACT|nr:nucleotidyl transferase AbiEii/AbiGii toxin family protein [Shiella aurantiaca]MDN4166437.1 nucleotidyl transferase AbiEii/AbiGii toxin family protein [Shiella aurantiaca]